MSLKPISAVILTCGTGVGGTCIYQYAVPKIWKEILTREGFLFLESDEEYKAVWADNKKEIIEKIKETHSDLAQALTEETAADSIRKWCQERLVQYPSSSEPNMKHYIVHLCTQSGILNIHGMLLYSKKTGFLSYDETTDDNKYKNVFALYKYNETFLSWLNEGKETKIQQSDSANEKFQNLKDKCRQTLTTNRKLKIKNEDYKYATWWCVPLKQETVKERIKSQHTDWEQETDGEKIKEKWQYTDEIKSKARKEGDTITDPAKEDYEKWCNEKLNKQLYEEDIYKETYIAVMSACKKFPSTS